MYKHVGVGDKHLRFQVAQFMTLCQPADCLIVALSVPHRPVILLLIVKMFRIKLVVVTVSYSPFLLQNNYVSEEICRCCNISI